MRRLAGHEPGRDFGKAVNAVYFDATGSRLYSGGDDRRIIAWSVPEWREVRRWDVPGIVRSLALSPDGKRLAGGVWPGGIAVLSTETGEIIKTLSGFKTQLWVGRGLAWLPDGRLVSGGGKQRLSILVADGLVYTAAHDGTLRRWNLDRPGHWVWDFAGRRPHTGILLSDIVADERSVALDPTGPRQGVGLRRALTL